MTGLNSKGNVQMSAESHSNFEERIYTVAVDCGPILWAVYCEICDENLNEGTQDEALVGRVEAQHQAFHLGLTTAEYRLSRRKGKLS